MADLIAKGLIEELEEGRWQLTSKGKVEADKAINKLSKEEQSLIMLRAALIIKKEGSR